MTIKTANQNQATAKTPSPMARYVTASVNYGNAGTTDIIRVSASRQ